MSSHGKRRLLSYITNKPLTPIRKVVGSDYYRSFYVWRPHLSLRSRPCDNMSCWNDATDPDCTRTENACPGFNKTVCKTCGLTDEERNNWYQLEPEVQSTIVSRVRELGYMARQFDEGIQQIKVSVRRRKVFVSKRKKERQVAQITDILTRLLG